MRKQIYKITFAAASIAIAVVFAEVVHSVGGREVGNILSPMHIPVLIAGMVLGFKYGLLVGILTPLVSTLTRGMPPIMPAGIGMCIELGVYGFISGLLSEMKCFSKIEFFKKHELLKLYLILISSMVIGRIAFGIYTYTYLTINGSVYTFKMFMSAVLIKPLIGILIQLYSIPLVVSGIKHSIRIN